MTAPRFATPGRWLPMFVVAFASAAFACGRAAVVTPSDPARGYAVGYRDGARAGRHDAQHRVWPNPQRARAYKDSEEGYDRRCECRAEYREQFRSGFLDGYEDAYQTISSSRTSKR